MDTSRTSEADGATQISRRRQPFDPPDNHSFRTWRSYSGLVPGFPWTALGAERRIEVDRDPVEREPLSFGDLILRHFRCHGIAKSRKIFLFVALRSCRGKVEPFVGEDEIQRNAVSLVVHQPEHRLRKRISLNGAPGVEIGGGIIVLGFAKTVFIQEAKQAECPGVSALSQG